MPNNIEFYELVMELDTPEKICNWLEEKITPVLHILYAPSPYDFWKLKEGNCNDYADFGRWVAAQHGIETYGVRIVFKGIIGHAMTIYVINGKYDYQNVALYKNIQVDTFREVIDHWQTTITKRIWTRYSIHDKNNHIVEIGYK